MFRFNCKTTSLATSFRSLEHLEPLYLSARDPDDNALVDVGFETEATISYPGVLRTDGAFQAFNRFGQSQGIFKYSRGGKLDVETILASLRVLDTIRNVNRDGQPPDWEGAISKAKEMVTNGAIFGEHAVQIIEAAAAQLDSLDA